MSMTKRTVFAALLVSALGGAALAQDAPEGMMGGGMMGEGPMGGRMMEGGPFGGFDFAAVDTDKDGKITQAEMQAWRAAEVAGVDADKDGKLSADELKAMQMKRMEERATDMATKMVERMDADGDGLLSAAELAARPGPAMMFDRIDADGDGAVTEEEIAAARAAMMDRVGEGHGRGRGEGRDGHGHGMRGWFFGNE